MMILRPLVPSLAAMPLVLVPVAAVQVISAVMAVTVSTVAVAAVQPVMAVHRLGDRAARAWLLSAPPAARTWLRPAAPLIQYLRASPSLRSGPSVPAAVAQVPLLPMPVPVAV